MNLIHTIRDITVPEKRKPFSWLSVIAPGLFLVLFGGAYLSFEFWSILIFTKPEWFFLLIMTPWFWWQFQTGSSGLYGFRGGLAQFVRLSVFGIFIMLLASPRAVRESNALNVIYTLDVSDSIGGDSVNQALKYIARTVQERPENDKAGLIIFGKNAAVELPPRKAFPLYSLNSLIQKDSTDIAKALSLTRAMLPQDENGRIVLISDGTSTAGIVNEVLDELSANKIPVDVLPIEYEFNNEVWLEKLELPQFIKQGETYEASVLLSSMTDGKGKLVLEENSQPIFSKEIIYNAGKNRYVLPIYLRKPGYYEYVARIIPEGGRDGWDKNNIAVNSIYLKGKGKIMLVKDSFGEARDWKLLQQALQSSDFDVEVKDSFDFPRDSMSLLPYDCVIFVNVPAETFDPVQFRSLKSAVYNQGTGFLMVGGKNSFGPGGYNKTDIEEILPVSMDITNKKVLPKGALAIILHTCEFPDGNTWAKRIAKAAIKVLGADDEVGLLAYDYTNGDDWIFPLTPAKEYNQLVKKINESNPGDMPTFANTMKLGLKGLKNSDAATKHMIIISDGDPSLPHKSLLQEFKDAKISISTVLVDGFHGGSFQKPMQLIANSTDGRFYYPQNPNKLPEIFIKEAKTLKRSMIQNKTFTPKIEFNDGALLKEINAFPSLYGYVLTSAKDDPRRCRVILRGPDKDQLDPILAIGQFGIGKSAAFTSDFTSNWAKDWMTWKKYQPLLKQIIFRIARVSKEGSLRMRSYNSGSSGVIVVEDFHPEAEFLEMAASIRGPNNKQVEVKLRQEGPRRYSANFPLWGKGRYEIVGAAVGTKRDERVIGSIVIPYSAEYLRFRSNPINLKEIAKRTNGKMLKGNESGKDIFIEERETRKSSKPIFDIFLILLACLIPIDVGIRRVQLDFSLLLAPFRGNKDKTASTATLGALLERKQKVGEEQEDSREETFASKLKQSSMERKQEYKRTATVIPKSKTVQKDKNDIPHGEEVSTTSRLLAKKRNRDDD